MSERCPPAVCELLLPLPISPLYPPLSPACLVDCRTWGVLTVKIAASLRHEEQKFLDCSCSCCRRHRLTYARSLTVCHRLPVSTDYPAPPGAVPPTVINLHKVCLCFMSGFCFFSRFRPDAKMFVYGMSTPNDAPIFHAAQRGWKWGGDEGRWPRRYRGPDPDHEWLFCAAKYACVYL